MAHTATDVSSHQPLLTAESIIHEQDHKPTMPRDRSSSTNVRNARHKTLVNLNARSLGSLKTETTDSADLMSPGPASRPFWLQRTTLIGFIAAFLVLTGVLLALWLVDRAHNGFSVGDSPQYPWTYGPTAVLVVVISFWRQVDYQCKMLQPWSELHKGPTSAERSILLDYVSPIQVTSLIKAIKYRHWVVVASVIGFAFLKLIVLFSTGLFVLSPTMLDGAFPLALTTNFSGRDFWPTVQQQGVQNGYGKHDLFHTPAYSNVGGSSVQAFLGSLTGIEEPKDILGSNTLQSFKLMENVAAQSISTDADVFVPRMSCEIAQPNITSSIGSNLNVTLRGETCSVGFEGQEVLTPELMGGSNCESQVCATPVPVFSMIRVNCSNIGIDAGVTTYLGTNTTDDLRFALLTGTIASKSVDNDRRRQVQATRLHPVEYNVDITTAVICKIDYSIERTNVLHEMDRDSFNLGPASQQRKLDDLTGVMLGEIMFAALEDTENLNLDFAVPPTSSFYSVMLETLVGEQTLERLLDSNTLQTAATSTFSGIAVHFMQQSYMVPSDMTSTANVTYTAQRLRVGTTSMGLMLTGFMLLILCTMCVDFLKCKVEVPRSSDSMATQVMVLRSSASLREVLRVAGSLRTSQLTALLRDYCFQATTKSRSHIEVARTESDSVKSTAKPKKQFWIPFAATHTAVCLMLVTPVVAIIVLEVLSRVSMAQHGIVDVLNHETTATVLSRYVTALIMLLIATCFNSFDFMMSSFAPFSLLRGGAVPATRVIYFNLLSCMPPVALVKSLRMRHYASVLSNMAGMTGSMLTIVASGLFFIDRAVIFEYPVMAHGANDWNIVWNNSSLSGDSGADVMLDRVQHGMATMPSSIWNDVVLPKVSDIRSLSNWTSNGYESSNYTLQLNALRPELECEVVADEYVKINGTLETGVYRIHASPRLPANCQRGGMNGTDDYINYRLTFSSSQTYCAELQDLHLGPWPEDIYTKVAPDIASSGEWNGGNYSTIQDNPAGCPSIGIIFAKTAGDRTSHADTTVLLCSQKLQQVSLNVTYKGSEPTRPVVNEDIAPILLESPVTYITNGTPGVDAFPWRVQTYLAPNIGGNFTSFNRDGEMQQNIGSTSTDSSIDIFFNNIIYDPDGTAPKDMVGAANRDNLIKAVQTLYNKYMSLVIDMKFRQPVLADAVNDQSNAVYGTQYVQTARLKVNDASKLALQIMLGVMVLLGLGAYWLTDLRGTLPRNPCSMASSMGFLAGSELCDGPDPLIPENAVKTNKQEQKKLFDGLLLSLGWWKDKQSDGNQRPPRDETHSTESLLTGDEKAKGRRFGIDVGMPEQLGFRETRWWRLRRRIARSDA